MQDQAMKPGWQKVKFGDVVRLNTDRCANPVAEGFERYVGLEHIDPDDLRIRRWGLVAEGTTFTNMFKPGQVLFGKRRAYQRKVAVTDFCGVCSSDIYVFEPKNDRLLPELLPFLCQTESFFEHAVGTSAGSLSPRTNWSRLAEYEFALPPAKEQIRIAELLIACEVTVQALSMLYAAAERLHIGVIEHYAAEAVLQQSTIYVEQLVRDNRPITYGILKPGIGHPGGVPVIKVKDYPNGEISSDKLLLTSPEIDYEYRRSRLEEGDLLISIRGTVGRLAFVPTDLSGANITQDTARLSIDQRFDRNYVRYMLQSNYVQQQIASRKTGMAVQGINIGELRKVRIPILKRDRQIQIAERLATTKQALQDALERYERSKALFSQLLAATMSPVQP